MPLLVPLIIFLILSVVLLAALANTKPPTSIDTVEALCDAILRNDVVTQRTLMTLDTISTTVHHALGSIADQHEEIARTYHAKIIKEWDDTNASYALVGVPLDAPDESLRFTCRYIVNQWTITAIQIDSPKIRID